MTFSNVLVKLVALLGLLVGALSGSAIKLFIEKQNHVEGKYTRIHKWEYNHVKYEIELSFDKDLYNHYHQKSRDRIFSYYTIEDPGYEYLDTLKLQLEKLIEGKNYSKKDVAQYLLNFVHTIEWQSDGAQEIPRFPIETLIDDNHDCEDLSLLFLVLCQRFGIKAALVTFPEHVAVAVSCPGCTGSSFPIDGEEFFYAECTSVGWDIGELPKDYHGAKANVAIIQIPDKPEGYFQVKSKQVDLPKTGRLDSLPKPVLKPNIDDEEDDSDMCSGCEDDDA